METIGNIDDFYVIQNTFKYQEKTQKSIISIKAHETKRCIPIFKTIEEAGIFISGYPGQMDIIKVKDTEPSLENVQSPSRTHLYIYFGRDGLLKLRSGEFKTFGDFVPFLI